MASITTWDTLFRKETERREAQTFRSGDFDISRIVSGKKIIRTNLIFESNFNGTKRTRRSAFYNYLAPLRTDEPHRPPAADTHTQHQEHKRCSKTDCYYLDL